ncbi:MAG: hypothetical protein K2L10_10210 [Ruminococcus sp.]|nr:hypothetical protein [Ruminococcus sp.]
MKNKGIVIELTALLDVILIMMFWLMMNLQNNNDNIRAEAEERISQAEQQIQSAEENVSEYKKLADEAVAEMEKMQAEIEEIRENTEREIAEAWKKAASINDNATANQYALDKYEQGFLITINLRYNENSGIFISDNTGILEEAIITPEDISEKLISAFENSGLSQNDVIMCAMTYDGSEALYRDVRTIRTAVYDIKEIYPNLYCTYINTKER